MGQDTSSEYEKMTHALHHWPPMKILMHIAFGDTTTSYLAKDTIQKKLCIEIPLYSNTGREQF